MQGCSPNKHAKVRSMSARLLGLTGTKSEVVIKCPHLGNPDPCRRHNGCEGTRALGTSFRRMTCGYPGKHFPATSAAGPDED